MARIQPNDVWARNSAVLRTVRLFRERLAAATQTARAVEVLEAIRTNDDAADTNTGSAADTAQADSAMPDRSSAGAAPGAGSESEATASHATAATTKPRNGPSASGAVQQAAAYRLWGRLRAIGTSSWLYRWLTKEPEPDVIVIDLRDTYAVGPFLVRLDEALRDLTPAPVRSVVVRGGARLRARTLERPVRIASFGTIVLVAVAVGMIATSSDPSGGQLFVLLGLLLLAVRGTQSTRSWTDIAETRWYQWMKAAFEPPAPAARPATADGASDASEPSEVAADGPIDRRSRDERD